MREVRYRLQTEVVGAFKTLLDAKESDVHERIEGLVDRVIAQGGFAVTRDERERLVEEMVHDVTGFGPLEPLLADPTITEVMVNGPDHIYIERKGKIQRIDSVFLNDQHVLRVIDRIITPLGRRIDESSPRVDARLPDGSRVNAVIEPLAENYLRLNSLGAYGSYFNYYICATTLKFNGPAGSDILLPIGGVPDLSKGRCSVNG